MRKLLFLIFLLLPSLLFAGAPSSTYTFEVGHTIQPSEVQQETTNIYRYLSTGVDTLADNCVTTSKILDGTIANADISGTAGIPDTKLATISTAGKVNGTALTGLASIPSGAGEIPDTNKGFPVVLTTDVTGTLPEANGGTGATAAANAASGVVVLDANSKISVAQLGAWVDKSASYGAQQAATDGFVIAASALGSNGENLYGYTDSGANPTTIRARAVTANTSLDQSIMFLVRKGDYWKVTTTGDIITVYWIPLGS